MAILRDIEIVNTKAVREQAKLETKDFIESVQHRIDRSSVQREKDILIDIMDRCNTVLTQLDKRQSESGLLVLAAPQDMEDVNFLEHVQTMCDKAIRKYPEQKVLLETIRYRAESLHMGMSPGYMDNIYLKPDEVTFCQRFISTCNNRYQPRYEVDSDEDNAPRSAAATTQAAKTNSKETTMVSAPIHISSVAERKAAEAELKDLKQRARDNIKALEKIDNEITSNPNLKLDEQIQLQQLSSQLKTFARWVIAHTGTDPKEISQHYHDAANKVISEKETWAQQQKTPVTEGFKGILNKICKTFGLSLPFTIAHQVLGDKVSHMKDTLSVMKGNAPDPDPEDDDSGSYRSGSPH